MTQWTAVTIVLTSMLAPMTNPIFASDDGGKVIATAPRSNAVNRNPFTDAWLADPSTQSSIMFAYQRGLMTGDPNGQFRPLDVITREEFAAVLVNVLHLPVAGRGRSSFADISDADWGLPDIEAATAAGLMSGDGGNFHPHDPITREQMAVALCKAAGLGVPGNGMRLTFADTDQISPWALPYVQAAVEAGLLSGDSTNFNPSGSVLRQDAAVIAVQLSNRLVHVIQSVQDGSVTVSGVTYQVADGLQGIFSAANSAALDGALLDAQFDGNTLTKIDRLVINPDASAGAQTLQFDGQGNTVSGDLVIRGGTVTLKNIVVSNDLTFSATTGTQTLNNVQVQATATLQGSGDVTYALSDDQFNTLNLRGAGTTWQLSGSTSATSLYVKDSGTLTSDHELPNSKVTVSPGVQLQLQSHVGELDVTGAPLPLITLSGDGKIDNLVLPSGVKGATVIANYATAMYQIPLINGLPNPDWLIQPSTGPHVYTRAELANEIKAAKLLESQAKPGTALGDTPQSAIDGFDRAIQSASCVADNADATPSEVDQATRDLRDAETTFKDAKIKPLSLKLQKGAKIYVNPSLPNPVNEVELSASSFPFYLYGKQSLTTMISVQNGNTPLDLEYDPTADEYKVLQQGQVVGDLHLTAQNANLQLNKGSNESDGDTLVPLPDLQPGSSVRVHVDLEQGGKSVSSVNIPVDVDTKQPTVNPHGTYNAAKGTIIVTTSEDLVPFPLLGGAVQPNLANEKSKLNASDLNVLNDSTVQVYGSPEKPYQDGENVVTLQNGRDYSSEIDGNKIMITLTDSGKKLLASDQIRSCKIVVGGVDYAWNPVDENHNSATVTIK